MTSVSIPLYRQSSFGFGIQYTILTLCGCGLVVFICFYILLGFLGYKVLTKKDTDEASDMQNTIETIEQLLKGDTLEKTENKQTIDPKDEKDLKNIEEEYSIFFDEDSDNSTKREALEEIKNYLKEEITNLPKSSESHLPKPMETIHEEDENSETEEVEAEKPENKKDGTSSDTKSSLIDFVLDKQKEELPPIGGGDDDS